MGDRGGRRSVSLAITCESGLYRVSVSPPHAEVWRSTLLLTPTQVLEELSTRGCHTTDITDALCAANPDWTVAHDAEVRRRREEELKKILRESTDDGRDE
jgi:hypothetical protein